MPHDEPLSMDRRTLLGSALAAGASLAWAGPLAGQDTLFQEPKDATVYSLNTSTIRGQKLPITEVMDITARAGYTAIEPWLREIDEHVQGGGSAADLGKRARDLGLTVASIIAFPKWIANDEAERKKALEEAKAAMAVCQELGCAMIAAPPAGGTNEAIDPFAAADRYRALCEVGQAMGVRPQLEVWGFSKTLSRLGEAVLVAVESDHPYACLLPDVYHVYKGGSQPDGIRLLAPDAILMYHLNDFPADPPRDTIKDSDRVYPGDGVGPVVQTIQLLDQIGAQPILSLELFNPDYWKQDAFEVASTGLTKMKACVAQARSQIVPDPADQ